jgi:hypothetical protein
MPRIWGIFYVAVSDSGISVKNNEVGTGMEILTKN